MGDIANLLTSLKTVAAQDYAKDIAPALSGALTQLAVTPTAAATIGTALLSQLATGGVQVAEDEVSALANWCIGEINDLANQITSSGSSTAATASS